MEYNIKAYAKVNIGLRVLPRREDGYHPLKTYFHLIELHDNLFIKIEESSMLSISIEGNESYLPNGKMDLMEKVARLFAERNNKTFSLFIKIEKHIPVQAGLGGGSSDAASVLLTLNEYFAFPMSRESLIELSLLSGSDIAFFLSGFKAAYAENRGETLTPVPPVCYPIMLLKKEGEEVSTKEAFRLLDEEEERDVSLGPWPLPLEEWRGAYINDFDHLQNIVKEKTYQELSLSSLYNSVSGSGSVCFMVYPDKASCEDASIILNNMKVPYMHILSHFCC